MKRTWIITALLLTTGLSAVGDESPSSAQFKPAMQTDRGRVLFSYQWNFLLLDNGSECYRVSTTQGLPEVRCGDSIEVKGVWGIRGGHKALESASYVRLDEPCLPPPVIDVTAEEFGELFRTKRIGFGSRLRLKARLISCEAMRWGMTDYALAVGDYNFHGWQDGFARTEITENNGLDPLVECTGILTYSGEDLNHPEEVRLWIASPDDVRIIPDAALRQRQFKRRLAKSWIALPILALGVIVYLLLKIFFAHRERALMAAVIQERQRMAADLHDTIEQHLAGASLFLDSILPIDDTPLTDELKAVETARQILMTAKKEIRETVWNLHVADLVVRPLDAVLRELADRARANGAQRVRTNLKGLPATLPPSVYANLIFIVQEALTNAIKHGHATSIALVADPLPHGFRLRIANDGTPFNTDSAFLPETGHFGLSGMRERARRSDIGFSITSDDRHTVVNLEIKS